MASELRRWRTIVEEGNGRPTYVVNYRVGGGSDVGGDEHARYDRLVGRLAELGDDAFTRFEDAGHASTSTWFVRSLHSAAELGHWLGEGLSERLDYLEVLEVNRDGVWMMDEPGSG